MANQTQDPKTYDSRWFIWTIVFLVVTGISLVSYIMISSSNDANAATAIIIAHRALTENQK